MRRVDSRTMYVSVCLLTAYITTLSISRTSPIRIVGIQEAIPGLGVPLAHYFSLQIEF